MARAQAAPRRARAQTAAAAPAVIEPRVEAVAAAQDDPEARRRVIEIWRSVLARLRKE